ncbi:TIGR02285 family protein [Spartinivicinus ruber]|uniref:TIGR02285 family protein n=1 Tax=Spartinivicinus ruber TaxID=2683272 RepID=UPI001CA3F65D|nr:TIGR02285 family protein [Spartinivicinus ruber]
MCYLSCTTLNAREKIHWQIIHWPPWMILEGKNKGQGFANRVLDIAEKELSEYEHIPVNMNWARFWLAVQKGQSYCNALSIKNPEREKIAYFSEPISIVLNNEIITNHSTAQLLGTPTMKSIHSLLADDRFHGGIEMKRSYGIIIDELIKGNNKNVSTYATSASSLLYMLSHGRIDYIIEYPIVVNYFTQNNKQASSLTKIRIEEVPEVFYGYIACTKNNWGAKVISRLSQLLKKVKPTKHYQRLLESGYTSSEDLATLRQYYPCFINNTLEQQCTTLHK